MDNLDSLKAKRVREVREEGQEIREYCKEIISKIRDPPVRCRL